jgi:hypothetical protein
MVVTEKPRQNVNIVIVKGWLVPNPIKVKFSSCGIIGSIDIGHMFIGINDGIPCILWTFNGFPPIDTLNPTSFKHYMILAKEDDLNGRFEVSII